MTYATLRNLARLWPLALVSLTAVFAAPGRASATSGIMYVGITTLTEDHYGTIVMGSTGYLNCNGHTIYNSTQPPVCYDNDSGPFQCGIYADWADSIDILNCNIQNFNPGAGISMVAGGDAWIRGTNSFFNGDGMDFAFTSGGSNSVFLFGSSASYFNADEGIKFDDVYNVRVTSTAVHWNGVDGIDSDYAHGILLDGNNLAENGDHAIEIDYGNSATVKSNIVDGWVGWFIEQNRDGIQLEELSGFNIESNTVTDAGRHGIYVHNASNGTVKTNNASGSARKMSGFDCRKNGGTGVTFTSNTFGTVSGC